MENVRETVTTVLVLIPFAWQGILLYKLSAYRRDGRGVLGTLLSGRFRVLRPDQYTDEGQDLLRWSWGVLLLTIPWCVGVILLLG